MGLAVSDQDIEHVKEAGLAIVAEAEAAIGRLIAKFDAMLAARLQAAQPLASAVLREALQDVLAGEDGIASVLHGVVDRAGAASLNGALVDGKIRFDLQIPPRVGSPA